MNWAGRKNPGPEEPLRDTPGEDGLCRVSPTEWWSDENEAKRHT